MLKIRRPLGRLIFNMGITIPGKTVFLIETAPWSQGSMKLNALWSKTWASLVHSFHSLGEFRAQFNLIRYRADSRFAPSQWERTLLCNDVSHWLGANLESSLLVQKWNKTLHFTPFINGKQTQLCESVLGFMHQISSGNKPMKILCHITGLLCGDAMSLLALLYRHH